MADHALVETIRFRPIATAPPGGGYVLLLGDSGYLGTPHRVAVGRRHPLDTDRWVTHGGEDFTDDGPPATHWAPWVYAIEEPEPTLADAIADLVRLRETSLLEDATELHRRIDAVIAAARRGT